MATKLAAPTTVTTPEGMSGQATHEQYGATIQPWNDPPVNIYLAAGTVDAAGKFKPMNGVRGDTGQPSPDYVKMDDDEFDALSSQTDWQSALSKVAQFHIWDTNGRPEASRPAWLPAGV